MLKFYEVGGHVRDTILGVQSNDIDYCVVSNKTTVDEAWEELHNHLLGRFQIFLETKECLTIRAKNSEGLVVDYVIARRESYSPGSRKPSVVPGTLEDDLARRDFTINSMAIDCETGELIDPHNGLKALQERKLVTPLEPMVSLADDPLRALRAVRFAVKYDLEFDIDLALALEDKRLPRLTEATVSSERIREELHKSFKFDTWRTWQVLNELPQDLVKVWLTQPGYSLTLSNKK